MSADDDLPDRILETAIELGEARGWDAVNLHEISRALDITLADVHRCFAQKDDIAEAWFDRADRAMLAACADPVFTAPDPRTRLLRVISAWLDALAPHRRLTAAMLGYKLHPEHIHLQLKGLTRISRTVQLIREAAALPAAGLRREVEEASLTAIYLATFACWLGDDSPGQSRTRRRLERMLQVADSAARRVGPWLPGSPRH